jgi:2,4-dienoyl-CoA reductase-like NADH-dependent reductase (Old Yellow Enzyme family)
MRLRDLTLRNRVIKAATHDGGSFEEMRRTYVRLAKNEVAMITVAYVAVSPVNKTFDNQHHIGADNAADWTNLCHAVHKAGGKMSAQLHHPGLFCMSSKGKPMGPSFFWLPSKPSWPHVMTSADLNSVRQEFIEAAKLCVACGFDCIELHCGHGYLLSQFLCPLINRRWDEYGGSTKGRANFPISIIRCVREAIGESMPIVVKMNTDDGFPFGLPFGLHLDESLQIAKLFAAAGVDAIIPSFGFTSLNGFGMLRGNVPLDKMVEALPKGSKWIAKNLGTIVVPEIEYESLFLNDAAQQFVQALRGTDTQVIYIGGADSLQAIERVLQQGCTAVQLGRPLLREPFFVRRMKLAILEADVGSNVGAEAELPAVASKCIRCNYCTLASIDPDMFKAGCVFLKPGMGSEIEDTLEIEDLLAEGGSARL